MEKMNSQCHTERRAWPLRNILLLMSIVVVGVGCGSKWKKTAPMPVSLEMQTADPGQGHLQITGGELVVKKFSFEGNRVQSNDVGFEEEFEPRKTYAIANGGTPTDLNYDIPQGTYTEVDTEIRFRGDDDGLSVLITGNFLDGANTTPFRFETEDQIDVRLETAFASNASEVIFEKDDAMPAVIELSVIAWLSGLSSNLLAGADIETVQGVPTILITKDNNESLYALVLARIGQDDRFQL